MGVVEKSGAWFYFDGQRLGQGKENVRKLIESDQELLSTLESLVRAKMMALGEEGEESVSEDEFDISDLGADDL